MTSRAIAIIGGAVVGIAFLCVGGLITLNGTTSAKSKASTSP